MQIISISGLDGSGKSTQIELLKNYLEKQGKKVAYFHAVQFSIANKHVTYSMQHVAKKTTSKAITTASWWKIQLRKLALHIDLYRFRDFVKKLEHAKFDYLLSDRYFYDNIINIAYLSKNVASYKLSVISSIPRPDFAFYLQIDPRAIMQRDRVPEQGLEYLQKKKVLLDEFAQGNKLLVINGNRDPQTIFAEIKEKTGL